MSQTFPVSLKHIAPAARFNKAPSWVWWWHVMADSALWTTLRQVRPWIQRCAFQHEGEQPDTWTPFCTSGCEGCGENGCHWCVNSIEIHLVKYIQANPYLPPTVQRLRVKGFVLPVKWGPTFREESKTLPKGDNEQTCMLPLLQLVRRK